MQRLTLSLFVMILFGCTEPSYDLKKVKVIESKWVKKIDSALKKSRNLSELNDFLLNRDLELHFGNGTNFTELERIHSDNDPNCYIVVSLSFGINTDNQVVNHKIYSTEICRY